MVDSPEYHCQLVLVVKLTAVFHAPFHRPHRQRENGEQHDRQQHVHHVRHLSPLLRGRLDVHRHRRLRSSRRTWTMSVATPAASLAPRPRTLRSRGQVKADPSGADSVLNAIYTAEGEIFTRFLRAARRRHRRRLPTRVSGCVPA